MLEFRAACIQAARDFFIQNGFLELDTPALAAALIPETCLEVFRTEYFIPFKDGASKSLFLTPSPEIYIKPIIAAHKKSVFQLSKCYRNVESIGNIHSPEFTMLEYYFAGADYIDSIKLTERFFLYLAEKVEHLAPAEPDKIAALKKPFFVMTMEEAFKKYAGFSLAEKNSPGQMAFYAEKLGIGDSSYYKNWAQDDLYELIFVHTVEPNLPKDKIVLLSGYPAFSSCLAKNKIEKINVSAASAFGDAGVKSKTVNWKTKERWELYAAGIELANCYTEARDEAEVNKYFEEENRLKQKNAKVPHPAVKDFGNICSQMPPCSGTALGFDRLIMFLAGKTSIESVLPVSLCL